MIGRDFGHYTFESRLGTGGMGEVYRARDTRLGRTVAIKVLPEVFAADPDRVERFEREAKVLASLNHPNIAALYGFEAFENQRFLVMEFAEGETLAERIARGPIPVGEALGIAHQIAEAFEAAHEKGIVHRDLKPGNIKINAEGKVKVLDFGLAKAMRSETADIALSTSPTRSFSPTSAGMVHGSPAYMSPEQAKGLAGDTRSDIFSFGCVLYEMLTGRPPFQGETVAEVIAGVIARPPDFTALPVNLNSSIAELLRRCLEKDPRRRCHAMADARVEIEVILADPRGLLVQIQAPVGDRPLWKRAIPMIAGLVVGGLLAGSVAWALRTPPAKEINRFVFSVPGFSFLGRQILSISPNGNHFVYVSPNVLQLRAMNQLDSFPIQGVPADARNPVFSPDGTSIVFWTASDGTLKRIPTSGGAPVTLCPADNPFGMSWGENDQIVFGQGSKGILRVSANAGSPEVLVTPQGGEILHGPQILPGGQAVLFTASPTGGGQWDQAKIFVQPLPSGERKSVIDGGTDARYLPTGHIVYYLAGNLLVVPFDLQSLTVTGRPVPVIEGVRFSSGSQTGTAQFSVSNTGTLIYSPGPLSTTPTTTQSTVTVVDSNGIGNPIALPANPYVSARVSPDGKQLAVGTDDGKDANIFVYDLSGKTELKRLTLSGRNRYPVWSGDSKRILFQSDREKDPAIWWQPADGTGTAERVTKPEPGDSHRPESWLAGQQKFSYRVSKNGEDVWLWSLEEKKGTPLIVIPGSDQIDSMFSRDGHWIVYRSTGEAGKNGIYVEPFPPTGTRHLLGVNENLAYGPAWSPDNNVFFHRQAGGQLHLFNLQTQPTLQHLNTVDLNVSQFLWSRSYRVYDAFPDGKRFVLIRSAQTGGGVTNTSVIPEIHVVLNWFEELKKLAPIP